MSAPDHSETERLAAAVIDRAATLGIRIATAESLTGGALAAALVSVPGASRVFSGGIVAYDTALKHSLLGVDAALLAEHGPVHAEVARQMARGVRTACAVPGPLSVPRDGAQDRVSVARDRVSGIAAERVPAELGIATTGVAGPDPDPQSGQPAGTVWLGLSVGTRETGYALELAGDRAEIRAETVRAALQAVLAELHAEATE